MGERACAAGNTAYQRLKAAFSEGVDKPSGSGCVWMLGDEVPEELILAAGLRPVRLLGRYGAQPNADKYLELSFGPQWRAAFERILNTPQAEFLVLANSSDLIQKLYYYLRQLARIEPERPLPRLHYVDYSLMMKDFSAQERNLRETEDFVRVLEDWTGRPVGDSAIREASALCNALRAALRRVSALRRAGRITASEALYITGGAQLLDKAEAAALVNALADSAQDWPLTGGIPALYTGSLQETPELYELIEDCGFHIAADDKLLGDRYADRDVDLSRSPLLAVTERYHLRSPSSERGSVAERSVCIPALAKESGAQAMILFMYRNDESYIWDEPKQRPGLEALGVRTLTVEKQECPLRDTEALRARLLEFAGAVRGEA